MKLNKTALGIAIGWFVIWFGLLYAIADHPVPAGFWVIPVVCAVIAGLIYWRVPVYQGRITSGQRGGFWLALLEGLALGFVLATVSVVQPVTPQPGLPAPGVADFVVIYVIFLFLGCINAAGVYLATRVLAR